MVPEQTVPRSRVSPHTDAFAAALPEVYGYLFARCGNRWLAEDLTSDAAMAAVSAIERGDLEEVSVGWLVVVARRRLVDHWRREHRGKRAHGLAAVLAPPTGAELDTPWDEPTDVVRCRCALARLGGHHRAALTLRYVDGLNVEGVARALGRGYEATEALLYRARAALRRAYEEEEMHHG